MDTVIVNLQISRRWQEIHALDKGRDTVEIINANATYQSFIEAQEKDHSHPSIALVSYTQYMDGNIALSVREIFYK